MMKRILSLLLCAVLICGLMGTCAMAEGNLQLQMSNATAKAGDTVTVKFSLGNNAGVTAFTFKVVYDTSVLEIQKVSKEILDEDDEEFGSWDVTKKSFAEDQKVMWYAGEPYTGTDLFTLTFKVADDAKSGTIQFQIDYGTMGGITDADRHKIPAENIDIVGGAITIEGDEPEPAGATLEIYGTSISLNGAIGLNVYVKPTEEQIADEGFTVKLNEQAFQFKDNYKSSDGLYRFPVSLRAKQMTDPVTVTAVDGEGNAVKLLRASVGKPEDSCDFSIADYVEKTVKTGTPEKLVALVKAMSRYGNLAQVALSYNTANLAPMYDQDALDTVTLDKVSAYQATATAGEASGVKYAGCSVVLDSETDLGIYLEADAGSKLADFTYTVNGKKASLVETSQGTCVKVANISAKNLDRENTIVVTNGEGKTVLTVKASAMSYVYGALNSSTLEAKYVNAAKALFLYCEAANTYWG